MIRWFYKYCCKPISILLSIYLINLSIDAADMEGNVFDPSVNEIESIVELVVEVILEKGDAMPEHDEPDPESETCFISIYHIVVSSSTFDLLNTCFHYSSDPSTYVRISYKNPILGKYSPPPRRLS